MITIIHWIFILRLIAVKVMDAGVLSIKFCLEKKQQDYAKHCGIYQVAKFSSDAC